MKLLSMVFILVAICTSLLFAAPVQAATPSSSSQSSFRRTTTRLHSSWPWYVVRASGIIAVVLLVLLMLSGMGLLTGHTYKFLEPIAAWATHRALGIAFGVSVFIHVFTLLFDHYASFNLFEILIPFLSHYTTVKIAHHNFGSLWMAMGITAFYAVAAVVITSLLWIDKKPRPWKLIHFISYAAAVLIFFHTLFAGTDFRHGNLRILWLAIAVMIGAYSILRLLRAGTMRS